LTLYLVKFVKFNVRPPILLLLLFQGRPSRPNRKVTTHLRCGLKIFPQICLAFLRLVFLCLIGPSFSRPTFLCPVISNVVHFHVRTLCCTEFGYLQNKAIGLGPTSIWNFAPNPGLRKFRHGKSIVLSTKLANGRACGSHLVVGRI